MEGHRSERGQVLVLIVLGIVVLFGFAALAVDLGRTYAERRRAQNAADASAMAAAFAVQSAEMDKKTITEAELTNIAIEKADTNGFLYEAGTGANPPKVNVEYHHPPISGPYVGNTEYHQVFITTTVDQSFSQLVFSGTQRLTVEAVAHSRPVRSITPGDAMYATNNTGCDAIKFSGSGETEITGGNIFSASDGTEKNGSCDALVRGGDASVTVNPPYGIFSVGEPGNNGKGIASPPPVGGQGRKELPDVPLPDCSKLTDRTFDKNGSKVLLPGNYSGGIDIQNGNWTMKPGLYCLYAAFHVNGGSLTGKDLMIVQWKEDIDFNGNAVINLTRANDLIDGANQHWGGMLIYMPSSNNGGIDLAGGGGTTYTGTIYAPSPRGNKKPKCTVGGNAGSIGLNSNLICNTIEVTGDGNVNINYREDANFRLPPIVELSQ